MFRKEEAQQIRTHFWTSFGVYMRKHFPAGSTKPKWLNYRTGLRNVYFRMEADNKEARVCIDIQHNDEGMRELFFEQFKEFKSLLHQYLGNELQWKELHYMDNTGKPIARIFIEKGNVNLYSKETWPELFQFFETKMIALDEFWADFGVVFKELDR